MMDSNNVRLTGML